MKKIELTKKEIAAVKKSIKHWEKDIIKPLVKGKEVIRFSYQAGSCELCNHFYSLKCEECPYLKSYDHRCDDEQKGHWSRFNNVPTLSNAVSMRNALARIIGEPTITAKEAKEKYA